MDIVTESHLVEQLKKYEENIWIDSNRPDSVYYDLFLEKYIKN